MSNGRSKSEGQVRSKLTVAPYENTNAVINRLMDEGDVIFICQGPYGRVPVLAATEQEAADRYVAKFLHMAEIEEEVVTELV